MFSYETLIIILYFLVTILFGICMGLLHSRNFWRDKYFEEVMSNEDIRAIR